MSKVGDKDCQDDQGKCRPTSSDSQRNDVRSNPGIFYGSSPNTVGLQVKLQSTAMEENGGLEMVLQGSSLVVPPTVSENRTREAGVVVHRSWFAGMNRPRIEAMLT